VRALVKSKDGRNVGTVSPVFGKPLQWTGKEAGALLMPVTAPIVYEISDNGDFFFA